MELSPKNILDGPLVPPGGTGWICLFSPQTWELAGACGYSQIAFPLGREKIAKRIRVGDIIVCYVSKRMTLAGMLKVKSPCRVDSSQSIYGNAGQYPVIGDTTPILTLSGEKEIPLHLHTRKLALFRGISTSSGWTVALRRSPKEVGNSDLRKLHSLITLAV